MDMMSYMMCARVRKRKRQPVVSSSVSTILDYVKLADYSGDTTVMTRSIGTKTPTNQSGTSSAKSQRSSAMIPDVNRSLQGLDTTTVVVKRGRHGYGFTVMGSSPVTIGKVDDGSPAASAGLRKNDVVVRINGQNVSRSTADSVAKIVKNSLKQIVLDVVRPNRSKRVTASSNFKTQENPVYGSVTSSNLYEFPSDACCEGFYGRASGAGSTSERSSRSSLTRKIPSGASLSSRGLNDTLPLRPSQSDNVASLSRSQQKTSLSSQSSRGSISIEESGKISCERSIRKSLRKTVTSQVHGVHIVTKAEMTITTNTYDSIHWDASNESIFFNENEEIYDELPWKPFDCNMMASPVTATEDTYETMCSVDDAVHDTANETFLDAPSDADESKMSVADYAHTTLPEMSFCDLSHRERARQAAACQLLRAEAEFIAAMQYGIQRYSRPLRHCILSAGEHRILFQNVEKLVAFSEYHVRQMAEGSLSYCDVNSSGRRYVDVVGSVYVQRAAILCEAYQLYARGLREALRLLSDLRTYEQFHAFLDAPAAEPGKPGIAEFLRKPEEHLQTLMVTLRTVLSHTSRDHCDAAALSRVVKAFSACCNKVQHTPTNSHSKNTSAGDSSSGPGTTSFTSGESSTSSHSGTSSSSTRSKSSSASVDSELLEIQERLVFPGHVTAFRLAVPSRHVIYSGELLRVEDCQWRRVVVVLLSDLLLVTRVEGDSLIVVEDPLPLPEVMNSEFGGSHPCEFTLTAEVRSADHVDWEARHILLRAPSMEQACTWKSLLQQRLANFRTHHELMTGRSREAVF